MRKIKCDPKYMISKGKNPQPKFTRTSINLNSNDPNPKQTDRIFQSNTTQPKIINYFPEQTPYKIEQMNSPARQIKSNPRHGNRPGGQINPSNLPLEPFKKPFNRTSKSFDPIRNFFHPRKKLFPLNNILFDRNISIPLGNLKTFPNLERFNIKQITPVNGNLKSKEIKKCRIF